MPGWKACCHRSAQPRRAAAHADCHASGVASAAAARSAAALELALAGRRRVLGRDHPDTLESMNSLGAALNTAGRYEEAEAMHSDRPTKTFEKNSVVLLRMRVKL